MRIATTASVALLALSTAALAQVAGSPGSRTTQNNMMGANSAMPGSTQGSTQDSTMSNHSGMDHSAPMNDTMISNDTMTPPGW